MRVEMSTAVRGEEAVKFWTIYDAAFQPLRSAAPCRQFLYEDEFMLEMVDERMLKFVLRDADDAAIGLALVATDLGAIEWASSEYFRDRFPSHSSENRIFYFGALLVEPGEQGLAHSKILLSELVNFVIRSDGIAAFDCYEGNNDWMPDFIEGLAKQQGFVQRHELEHQYYYALESKGFRRGCSPKATHANLA